MLLELLVEKKRSAACGRRQRGETGKYTKTYDFDLTSLRLLPRFIIRKRLRNRKKKNGKKNSKLSGASRIAHFLLSTPREISEQIIKNEMIEKWKRKTFPPPPPLLGSKRRRLVVCRRIDFLVYVCSPLGGMSPLPKWMESDIIEVLLDCDAYFVAFTSLFSPSPRWWSERQRRRAAHWQSTIIDFSLLLRSSTCSCQPVVNLFSAREARIQQTTH